MKFRIDTAMGAMIYKILKKGKAGRKWSQLVGYSVEELKRHIEKQFAPEMIWENWGKYWHIDHIVPKSLFKYSSPTEDTFKKCWALDNLQPLEAKENLRKNRFPSQALSKVKQLLKEELKK